MVRYFQGALGSRAHEAPRASTFAPFALFALLTLAIGCDRKDSAGAGGSCPGDWPAAKGCQSANQECPYDKDGKKWRCTCTPDTQGPSTWQCTPLE